MERKRDRYIHDVRSGREVLRMKRKREREKEREKERSIQLGQFLYNIEGMEVMTLKLVREFLLKFYSKHYSKHNKQFTDTMHCIDSVYNLIHLLHTDAK